MDKDEMLCTSSDKVWKEREANDRLIGAISLGRRWSFATRQKLYKPRE